MSDFAGRLKQWRGTWLQKEAADKLNISVRTYEAWEEGAHSPTEKPSIREIEDRMRAVRFKDKLRDWRNTHSLNQKDAAAKLDVTTATIRKWEAGKRTPGKLALAELTRRMGL